MSTALGVALVGDGPTVALVGDLAFLHDSSAPVSAQGCEVDLTVVVADNRGGGIFSFLAPAETLVSRHLRHPVRHATGPGPRGSRRRVRVAGRRGGPGSTAGLDEALARRMVGGSWAVLRVVLPDRPANVVHHRELHAAVVAVVDQGERD